MPHPFVVSADELAVLQSQRGYPLITLAMPTHRHFPNKQQDPIRFKDLVRQVRDRLAQELPARQVEQFYQQLVAVGERIDWSHTLDGLVVFIGNGIERIVYLPLRVRERAVIDHTFATRDLVVAQSKLLRYWVVSLSTNASRLFEGYGDHLVEITNERFPFPYDGPRSGDPENPLPGGFGINPSAYRDEHLCHYFHRLDQALRHELPLLSPPLFIIGTVRNRAFFAEVRSRHYDIIAELDGTMDHASPHQIAEQIAGALEAYLDRRASAALEEIEHAIKAGTYTCSLADMWHSAQQGRAELLLVERNFAAAAQWDPEHRMLTIVDDPTAPGVIDDIVDEIIEAVLNHRGRVVFVRDGQLQHCGHIAMALRY